MTVLAISCCLESILQDVELHKKLPPSMSSRMKIASILAEHIKSLSFRGDMDYSTILYGSELEVRRILMFLIERIPRDPVKTATTVPMGYVPRLLKEIDDNLKWQMKHLWVPASMLNNGIREHDESSFSIHSFGNSVPLMSKHLTIPYASCEEKSSGIFICKSNTHYVVM